MRHIHLSLIGLLALALDQIAKAAALTSLAQGEPISVLPGFNLTLGFNTGASFGMLSGVMKETPLAMVALTGAITLGPAVLALRVRSPWKAAGFALLVGGSLGNIVDRLRQGQSRTFWMSIGGTGTGLPSIWRTLPSSSGLP